MTKTLKMTSAASLVAISSILTTPLSAETSDQAVSWGDSLRTFGLFHKDNDAKFIQELKFHGRFHWQYAHIDGEDAAGDSFDNDFTEFRRIRIGAQAKFLNNFTLRSTINVINDGARDGQSEQFEYNGIDELFLTYSLQNVGNLDSVALRYGRQKIDNGAEVAVSSKKIKTVERAAISNKLFSNSRYTALKALVSKGNWDGQFSLLSLDDNEELAGWSRGKALALNSDWKLENGKVKFDVLYNLDANDSGRDELDVDYKWAASLAYETKVNDWNLFLNAVYGDNGSESFAGNNRDGSFYGLIVMPSTYLIEDKLEFVARYQYQASSQDEGIRVNSRYFRANDNGSSLSNGRGDSHQSIYAGLNYFISGHHSKVQVGIEYDTLDTPTGDADATTVFAAYRTYF